MRRLAEQTARLTGDDSHPSWHALHSWLFHEKFLRNLLSRKVRQ